MSTADPPPGPPLLLVARGLTRSFAGAGRGPEVRAVDGVDLDLAAGETLGIVGESGSGKSTLAAMLAGLLTPTSGSVALAGARLDRLRGRALRVARRDVQLVAQDPYDALDPRWDIATSVREPLDLRRAGDRAARRARVAALLDRVGLTSTQARRRPHELSGGQRQRAVLARALASDPTVLVCDEVVSALDVSVQAQVLNLLDELRADLGLACVFVSHDLGVVAHVSDRIAVMYLGRMVETGPLEPVHDAPAHPYTAALLNAVPGQGRNRAERRVPGEAPDPADPPPGCPFHPRCRGAQTDCTTEVPVASRALRGTDRSAACHHPLPRPTAAPVP